MKIKKLSLLACSVFFFMSSVSLSGRAEQAPYQADTFTRWMAVYHRNKKIGYLHVTRSVEDGKVITRSLECYRRGEKDSFSDLQVEMECVETRDGKPLEFRYREEDSGILQLFTGSVSSSGLLSLKMEVPGHVSEKTFPWPEGAVLEEGYRLSCLKSGFKKGTSCMVKYFFIPYLAEVTIKATIGEKKSVGIMGQEKMLTQVEEEMISEQGHVRKRTSFMDESMFFWKIIDSLSGEKLVIEACSKETALRENQPFPMEEVISLTVPVSLWNADFTGKMLYRFVPRKEGSVLSIPSTDEQAVTILPDGSSVVVVEVIPVPEKIPFPYAGDDKDILEYLKPNYWVQSDSEEIIQLAKKIAGDSQDSASAVEKIHRYMSSHFTYKDVIGYATSLETLQKMEGNCTEYAVFMASLFRTLGIPARIAFGIGFAEPRGSDASVFSAHAWPQIYTGGRWISVDQTSYPSGSIAFSVTDGRPPVIFDVGYIKENFEITEARPLGGR